MKEATCLVFDLMLFYILPYFVHGSMEDSGELQMHRLVWTCNKYQNLMDWLIFLLKIVHIAILTEVMQWLRTTLHISKFKTVLLA